MKFSRAVTKSDSTERHVSIRFRQGDLDTLRNRLLADLSRECFAVLLGKREIVGELTIVTVHEMRWPNRADYRDQSITHLSLQPQFIYDLLCEATSTGEIDSIIDVHTHPFSHAGVAFSGVDDRDEEEFFRFLDETFEGIHFGSIVFSQSDYSARIWDRIGKGVRPIPAILRTQTALESCQSSSRRGRRAAPDSLPETDFLHRATLALGIDAIEKISADQEIVIVGLGGLGSVIAENLIHMGFQNLALIDPDTIELSNLSRIVGGTRAAVDERRAKVDCIRDHLLAIQPGAKISSYTLDVHDAAVEEILARADWVLVATDNHSSRFRIQRACFRYYVPFISVGVNISVENGAITDVSGEVILVRCGDRHCLSCLGRLNPQKIAVERQPESVVGLELVNRGYVSGVHVKQPAVKTLNSILAALAVDILINQFTGRQANSPIVVYESNGQPAIYPDELSLRARNLDCFSCGY